MDSFIEYKDKQYKGFLALYFDYKFFEGNKEVLFAENDNPSIAGINIVFNKEKGYEIELTPSLMNYDKIVVSPNKEATLWLDLQTPVKIPFEDAVKLLIKYADKFDISDNKPADTTTYFSTEVKC